MHHTTHHPGPAPQSTGPHRHDILNKLDPTVDDRSGGVQILGPGVPPSTHGSAPMQHGAVHSGVGHSGVPQAGVKTHHNVAYAPQQEFRHGNTVDPRVDVAHRNHGAADVGGGYGYQPQHPGVSAPEGTYGPHSSRLANTVDPRVDSDADGRARHYGTAVGGGAIPRRHEPYGSHPVVNDLVHPGPASNTAGPHKSNLLNKLDPTVDSKATVSQAPHYRTG